MAGQAEKLLTSFHLSEEDARVYVTVIQKFDDYYKHSKNLVYEQVRFLQRNQRPGESVDSFITDLTALAQSCDWGEQERQLIKLKIIAGLATAQLSQQLQASPDDTLEKVIQKVRVAKHLKAQQAVVRAAVAAPATTSAPREEVSVAAVQQQQRFTQPRASHDKAKQQPQSGAAAQRHQTSHCRYCGLAQKHPRKDWPAAKVNCSACRMRGHYAKMCEQTQKRVDEIRIVPTPHISDEDCFYLGALSKGEPADSSAVEPVNTEPPWLATVNVEGVPVTFKLDSGADVCLGPPELLHQLPNADLQAPLKPLRHAGNKPLEGIAGRVAVDLTWGANSCREDLYILRGLREPLLSRHAIARLGMLAWPSPHHHIAAAVSHADLVAHYDALLRPHADLFSGTGKLGAPYEIRLKEDAQPFAIHYPSRVAIPMRDGVRLALDAMVRDDVVFPVEQPTPYCAPMVPVKKRDGTLRITVDFTQLNKNILRERYMLPTVDECTATIDPQASVFSVLDAKAGFHQVLLTPASQLLTTFITPFGRYAYKRLPMALTSAMETYQRRMATALEGLEGVINLADDTLVYGRTRDKHDKRLRVVIERLAQQEVILNKKKCKFGEHQVHYLGRAISSAGVAVDPARTEAILHMRVDKSVTGVRSFLGIVQVQEKYLRQLADMSSRAGR